MKLLIVYEDECPCNPIVYVGKIREDVDLWDAVLNQVQFACVDAGIDDIDYEDVVYELVGMENFTWVREHWCFAIKEVEG